MTAAPARYAGDDRRGEWLRTVRAMSPAEIGIWLGQGGAVPPEARHGWRQTMDRAGLLAELDEAIERST